MMAMGTTSRYRTPEYERRLKSAGWKRLREDVMAAQWGRCGRCGHRDLPLELHHRHYGTLGAERPQDVVALCQPCHAEADEDRAAESGARSASALWNARLSGWADKTGYEIDDPEAEEAFVRWLDEKGED